MLKWFLFLMIAFTGSTRRATSFSVSNGRRRPSTPSDFPESIGRSLDWETAKASPAMRSIEGGDMVRQIREQRSTRGKRVSSSSSLSSPKQPPGRKRNRSKPKGVSSSLSSLYAGTSKRYDLPYESALQALQVFYAEHEHLILPRKHIVQDLTYPPEWQGADLAGTVYDMKWWTRHIKQRPDRVATLNGMGFCWERLQEEWNLLLEGLVTYGIMHGDMLVPAKYVIPHGDENYPRSTWGIALGNAVYRIRNRGDFLRGTNAVSRRNQLDSLGFVWDVSEHRFLIFCRALRIYAQVQNTATPKGALKIPATYVVPKDDNRWPQDIWGYPLGAKCVAVRQKELYVKGYPERLQVLADLGFHGGGNDSLSWLEVVHAAAIYSQMHSRTLDVPSNFVIPAPPRQVQSLVVGSDEAWPWPEYLWGFPLGQRLRDVRVKGYYMNGRSADARRRQLNALGYVWTPKRGRRMKSGIKRS